MFTSTAHAAGTDNLPMPDSIDPAVFKYLFWGLGVALALFVAYKVIKRVIRR